MKDKEELLDQLEIHNPSDSQVSRASHVPGEHHYDSYFEYVLSLIGFTVGFGAFWRFPYMIYKNGGGAFLIPYFTALIMLGIPLLYMETAVGQMHQRTIPFIFGRINKGYKLIGGTFLFTCYHFAGYYNIILAYSYRFIFSAFETTLPFAQQSASQNHYFSDVILNKSDSIGQFGGINPILFFLYILSLLTQTNQANFVLTQPTQPHRELNSLASIPNVCYLVIKNGVKTSGKIIVFTALVPYFFFLILLIRAFFLEGAVVGLKYLLVPDFSKLFGFQIWIDAIVQVFYQMTVACSGIINLSSLKPKTEKFMLGIYIIPISIIVCGMMCALNIFMYLGHFCYEADLDIGELTLLGPELSFNVFPKALAILPWPNLWVLCFFIAMVFLGIDSQFGYLESLLSFLKDENQANHGCIKLFDWELGIEKAKTYLFGSIVIFAPLLTSHAGIYYLGFFDTFVSNIPLSLGVLIEYCLFVKIFPFQQLQEETMKYTGEKAPQWIATLLEGKAVMIILIVNFGIACLNQMVCFTQYSLGFYIFGWTITAYPYILAYIYYTRNKELKSRRTFEQIKKRRISQL